MASKMPHRSVPLLLLLAAGASACVKGRKPAEQADEVELPAHPIDATPVEATRSSAGLLEVRVDVRDDGLLLHIAGTPADARLECDLDATPLLTCHDGAVLTKPAAGDHKISVTALVGNAVVALGASAPFTVLPGAPVTPTPGEDAVSKESLAMIVDDPAFTNGMTASLAADFKVAFRLAAEPACAAAIKCRYDSRTSPFWTDCDEGGKSFSIPKELLAAGLQFISVQASCLDQLGPILNMFFYGVPPEYKPLMLRDLKDGQGRHVVNLMKGDDCPESQQRYECAATPQDAFALCANGNVIDKPTAGFRVRLRCGDAAGPELTLAD